MTSASTKTCNACREERPLTAFHVRARSSDGRQPKCKACALEARRVWRETKGQLPENKAKAAARTSQWRERNDGRWQAANKAWADANPEKVRAAWLRHRGRNPGYDAIKAREYAAKNVEALRAYRQGNKDRLREARNAWLERNPGRANAYCAARRARLLQATPAWADMDAIREVYEQAKVLTELTGIEHHVDHIIPLKNKRVCGLHVLANLQILPGVENIRKSNRIVVE